MKIKFNYIKRQNKRVYAFSGDFTFESETEILQRIKKYGRQIDGEDKSYKDLSEKEIRKEVNDDFVCGMKQPDDVFSMFKKYFGIELYDVSQSDCIKHPDKYITIFSEKELRKLRSREYKNYWHFVCNYVRLCPKVATINFAKMAERSASSFWRYKITLVLQSIFGDKETFYFSKWLYVGKPKITTLTIDDNSIRTLIKKSNDGA